MRRYGWRHSRVDHRDLHFKPKVMALPPVAKSLTIDIPSWDQGQLGSCTGHGVGAVVEQERIKQGQTPWTPSRLAIYYNGRLLEGTTKQDSGCEIRDVIKGVVKYGVCPESDWPYVTSKFAIKPPKKCYSDGLQDLVIQYQSVQPVLLDILTAIAQGLPVVGGFTVYESFESAKVASTGVMSVPKRGEQELGGHCVVWDGYDQNKKVFRVRNSWGPGWGMGGWFTMPFACLQKCACSDFWIVQKVS